MDFSKLNFLLPDQFSANSLADKFESANKKLIDLVSGFDEGLELFDPEGNEIPTKSQFITTVLRSNTPEEISSTSCIAVSDGFTTAEDLASKIYDAYSEYYQGNIDEFDSVPINLYNAAGDVMESTIGDTINSLKEGIVSAASQATALRSMVEKDAASKIAYFTQKLSSFVDVNSSQYSNIISYYKDQIISTDSVRDLINIITTKLGVQSMADEDPITISNTEVGNMTGASPLSAFSLSTTASTFEKVGHAIGVAFVGVAKAVAGVAKWLFNKGKKWVTETFVNPYDVTDTGDSSEKPCFVGYQYQARGEETSSIINSPALALAWPRDSQILSEVNAYLATLCGDRWYKVETYAGELCFQITAAEVKYTGMTVPLISTTRNYVFKPYVINPDTVINTTNGFTVADEADHLASFTGDLYLDANADELTFARGLYCGVWQSNSIMGSIFKDLVWQYCQDINVGSNTMSAVNPKMIEDNVTITNRDFLLLACGYYNNNGVTSFKWPISQIDSTGCVQAELEFGTVPNAIMLLKAFQRFNPLNRTYEEMENLYIPYEIDKNTISHGRFSIKTDSQNQDVANAIVAVIIVVAILVTGIISAKVIAKKVSRKRFWKRTEFIGRCDNAMWNGEVLSASDKRKYIRFQRKLNASNLLTSGIIADARENANDASSIMNSAIVSNILGFGDDQTESVTVKDVAKMIKL